MNFNLEKTKIFQAVSLEKQYLFNYDKSLKKIFCLLTLIFALLYIPALLYEIQSKDKLLGLLILSTTFWIFFVIKYNFFNLKIKKTELETPLVFALSHPDAYNLAEFLDFDTAKLFSNIISFCKKERFQEINTPAFLEVLIKNEHPLS